MSSRPSLIDQMALAAALEDLGRTSSGEEDDASESSAVDEDAEHEVVFTKTETDQDEEVEVGLDGVPQATTPAEDNNNEDANDAAGDSEECDILANLPVPVGVQGRRRSSRITSLDDSAVSSFNMSTSSEDWVSEEISLDENAVSGHIEDPSPQSSELTSSSMHSAPAGRAAGRNKIPRRRAHSFAVKKDAGRRGSYNSTDEESSSKTQTSGSGSFLGIGSRLSNLTGRRPPRNSAPVKLENAIETLRQQDANDEWENVAAAVTVVAASSQPPDGKTQKQRVFCSVDDTVLVMLTLMNVTAPGVSPETFTINPVNRFGYPPGRGKTDEEKEGPFTFVLATVKSVNFEESVPYYTVVRADTGLEQRAETDWMEILRDPVAIEAATQAAKITAQTTPDVANEEVQMGVLQNTLDHFLDIFSWSADYVATVLVPLYRRQRATAKQHVTKVLYGDAPFACKVRLTGINFLVLCSLIFLFLEVINLGFLPADWDKKVAILGSVVWGVLVLELLFEVAIRPKDYSELIESDKAFAPSTARYIDRFHLVFEAIALLSFLPEFGCVTGDDLCSRESKFSRVEASVEAVLGEKHSRVAWGRFILGTTVLRLFGLIRRWKQMYIVNASRSGIGEANDIWGTAEVQTTDSTSTPYGRYARSKKSEDESNAPGDDHGTKVTSSEEDQRLKNAANIGTALMVVNSRRALVLLTAIFMVLPLLQSIAQRNEVPVRLVELLQANNVAAPLGTDDDCAYLRSAIESWTSLAALPQPPSFMDDKQDTYVLWAQLLPVRCDFQDEEGVVTICQVALASEFSETCRVWNDARPDSVDQANAGHFATELTLRIGGIRSISRGLDSGELSGYNATVIYNENPTVALVNVGDFYLLLGILLVGVYGLAALRGESIRLVLDPLQRMLKIVLRYAENPLSQDTRDEDSLVDDSAVVIGNYETEQLINAITRIADLLRKCWGVAGAGIISSNLARTEDGKTVVFNPTVPGNKVYALFGFVAINGFSDQLRALDRDVLILINDVANVVHDEIYRWALFDHGQCNKNLGSAFLMVFRIGDFSEVHKRKQEATEYFFKENGKRTLRERVRHRAGKAHSSVRKRTTQHDEDGQLELTSLPGISSFTERALLGMLKSFAGVHRDKNLCAWKNDFRLTAGVSSYHVDIIYGMDAGWAVEGAVGSEYKIDATYLSPHVNMASRMMSATKQYGVTLLMSKAVEELVSTPCRDKLRHIDTVYVKGSAVKQDIFSFDARFQGVDFFLIERTPEQADYDAETYDHTVWDRDQDLCAMRQHVTDDFMAVFKRGLRKYLSGSWKEAYAAFERASHMMMETVLQDGFLEYDLEELEDRLFDTQDQGEDIVRVRQELGDGASLALMSYMERRNLQAPPDWSGVRQLYSK